MSKPRTHRKPTKHINENQNIQPQKTEKQPPWAVVRGLLTCRHLQTQQQQQQLQQQKQKQKEHEKQPKQRREPPKLQQVQVPEENIKKCKKMKCSGSLCSNTKVMHKPETGSPDIHKKRVSLGSSNSHDTSSRSMKAPLHELNGVVSASSSSMSASSNSSVGGSFRGMPFRRFSGCYECRMVVDPVLGFTRDPSLRASICSCPECGEIFMKAENLELHQAVRHAVSELGPEDTSKNIVEIIFQSSWLRKQSPICKIDRILKVHNTQKTISKFEEYRDSIKAKATKLTKKHPRCIADGNELLRFHCTTFVCSLGLNGSSNLCNSIPQCNVCSIIKNGFRVAGESEGGIAKNGIFTTATSGKAHDKARLPLEDNNNDDKRAMLVCRVIAGRVKKNVEGNMEEYDSLAGAVGAYSNLDELYVYNPRAILPCFVVIYGGF
ncbi:C2H2-like zinc finger protein [Quillaja saponaria]|uniref:C2H2-like zinc finger protein n=1 Tax=Quillaja saponaria TaxID=32244 RepID=A0AAD7LWS4_QUISA|nr:C2H2-like zinc finger protein [Quillaja saponaria]